MAAKPDELHHLTIAAAGPLLRSGELSASELTEAFLARIAAVDGRVHSYITVLAERARSRARELDGELRNGRGRGPLHGIPFAVKDNYHVAGVPTTAGSRVLLDHIADRTATIIRRLEDAGAVLLGKLNTWEYGTGNANVHHDLPFPVARNPWDTRRFTGGSSTGAGAAVAAGTAMFALGSDTGGSIRLPAAACGVQGLKSTYGLVSRAHCLPNCWSLDYTGPLAWTVTDLALVLNVIAGRDGDDPSSARIDFQPVGTQAPDTLRGRVIGIVRDLGKDTRNVHPANLAAMEEAAGVLATLGADVVEAKLPAPLDQYRAVARTINWAESYSLHRRDYEEHGELMGRALREKMVLGAAVTAEDYLAAQRERAVLARRMDAFLQRFDAILLPNAFHLPPRFDEPETIPPFTTQSAASAFNVSGHPALSLCTGFNSEGLPLNAQLVAPYFREEALLQIGMAYERGTAWRERRPTLSPEELERPAEARNGPGCDPVPPIADAELVKRAKDYGRAIDRSFAKDAEPQAVFRVGNF
ncbi:amidase [Bosea thiooxidans]|nr:amidase [Bosea sp. (in: a-proteobacteria)]